LGTFFLFFFFSSQLLNHHKTDFCLLSDAAESAAYLRGTWSTKFGYPAMPFDAVLLASRVMVAKEALTANEAKDALVTASG
jgi:enoyl reductase-like protein